jgi:hypothetical protein
MKAAGMSTAVIAAELGYKSEGAARVDIGRALKDSRRVAAAWGALGIDVSLELERLDLAERTAQAVRLTAQGSQEYAYQFLALGAVDRLLRIHDRRVKLLALAAASARPPREKDGATGRDDLAERRRTRRNRFRAATG